MKKREIRTTAQNSEVAWWPWVAFAGMMVFVAVMVQFVMHVIGR